MNHPGAPALAPPVPASGTAAGAREEGSPGKGRLQAHNREGGRGGCGATRALPLHTPTVFPGRERPSQAIYPTQDVPKLKAPGDGGLLKHPKEGGFASTSVTCQQFTLSVSPWNSG